MNHHTGSGKLHIPDCLLQARALLFPPHETSPGTQSVVFQRPDKMLFLFQIFAEPTVLPNRSKAEHQKPSEILSLISDNWPIPPPPPLRSGAAFRDIVSVLNLCMLVLGERMPVRHPPSYGVPQGSILSPMLINIYMTPLGQTAWGFLTRAFSVC